MIITNSRYALVGYFITSYPTRAQGIIVIYSPIFKTAHVAENIWRIINTIASFDFQNMVGYLSLDIICFLIKLTVFLEICSRKTVRFSELNVTHNRKDNCLCGRKVGEISVVPDPRAACHVRGQYSELVSASGI